MRQTKIIATVGPASDTDDVLDALIAAGTDIVRLGLSHPCTALDKWTLIPVVDDAAAEHPVVTDYVRTYF